MQHKAIYAANFNALHISKHDCANFSHISTTMRSISLSDPIKRSPPGRAAHNQSRSGSRSSDAIFRAAQSLSVLFLRSFCRSARLYKEPSICRSAPFCAYQANDLSVPFYAFLLLFKLHLLHHFAPFRKSSFCAILRFPEMPLSVPFCAIFCACFYINSRPNYMERLYIIRRVLTSQSQKQHPIRSVSAPLPRSLLSRADC